MKRRIRVFPGMQLMETSCCGLPAYADAHKNTESLSLTKSFSKYFGENEIIKFEEKKPMENEVLEKAVETKTEVSAPAEIKTEKLETEKSEKVETVKEEAIAKAVAVAMKEAMKEMETERALVEKSKQTETKKSIGELALEMFRREHKD